MHDPGGSHPLVFVTALRLVVEGLEDSRLPGEMHTAMGIPLETRCERREISKCNRYVWRSARRAASGQGNAVHRRFVNVGEERLAMCRTNSGLSETLAPYPTSNRV